jgi:hypothetical protein
LQTLAALEDKAKDSLEKVISQKNDLLSIKAEVLPSPPPSCPSDSLPLLPFSRQLGPIDQEGSSNSSTNAASVAILSVSPVYDIIWGMYCVPAPKLHATGAEEESLFLCRTLVKSREFPIQAYPEYLSATSNSSQLPTELLLNQSNASHLSALLNKEQIDLIQTLRLIKDSLPSPVAPAAAMTTEPASSSGSSDAVQSIYLKEFTIAELASLQGQLRAESLRVHTIKDKFTSSWSADHPSYVPPPEAQADAEGDGDERFDDRSSTDSRDSRQSRGVRRSRTQSRSFSRPRSRGNSWNSRHNSQSSNLSLLGRLTSTVRSIFDGDGIYGSGFGSGRIQSIPESIRPIESPCGCGIIWEGKALLKVCRCLLSLSVLCLTLRRDRIIIPTPLPDTMPPSVSKAPSESSLAPLPIKIFFLLWLFVI